MSKKGKSTKIPGVIKKILLADEEVLVVIRQSRLKAIFTPDSIIVTNYRIIKSSPSKLGLHHDIEDYRYEDVANLKIDRGILFSNIIIKRRFMSEDLVLHNLRTSQVDYLSRVIGENLRRNNVIQPPQYASFQQASFSSAEDPMHVLRMRYAKGELTQEQFEDMKKKLG